MDREIPKEVRQKERNKKIIRYSAIGVAGVIVVSVLISLMRVGVEEKDIVFSTMEENIGIFPLSIDNEKIIGITDDDWMPLSSLMNAKNANISNQEILKELTDNSNPILVKYYFK